MSLSLPKHKKKNFSIDSSNFQTDFKEMTVNRNLIVNKNEAVKRMLSL